MRSTLEEAAAAPRPPRPPRPPPPEPPARRLLCSLRARSLTLDGRGAATYSAARVAHRWSLPGRPDPSTRSPQGKWGGGAVARGGGAFSLDYRCECGFSVASAPSLAAATQIVEVWATGYDGVTERLVGLARVGASRLAARVDAAARRLRSQTRGGAGAAAADAWLLDGEAAIFTDASSPIVDPKSGAVAGRLGATLAVGSPSQLAVLDDARRSDRAAALQALYRGFRARRGGPGAGGPEAGGAEAAPRFRAGGGAATGAPAAESAEAPAAESAEAPAAESAEAPAAESAEAPAAEAAAPRREAAAVEAAAARTAAAHVLEIGLSGPCDVCGDGCAVTFALPVDGVPRSLWWDADTGALNSRSRHSFLPVWNPTTGSGVPPRILQKSLPPSKRTRFPQFLGTGRSSAPRVLDDSRESFQKFVPEHSS